jgi:hypothetical protein
MKKNANASERKTVFQLFILVALRSEMMKRRSEKPITRNIKSSTRSFIKTPHGAYSSFNKLL